MKKMFLVLLLAGVGAVASPRVASAQSNPLVVKVPFDFIVSNRVLPAGSYRITSDEHDPSLLLVSNTGKTAVGAFVGTELGATGPVNGDAPRLTFRNVDGHMFLASIAVDGDVREVRITKAEAERTLASLNMLGATYSTK